MVGPSLTIISSRRELFRQAGRDAEDRAENIQPMQLLKMIIPSTVAVWPPSLSAQLGSWAAALAAIRPAVTSAACSLTASLATWHGTFQAIRPCPSTSLAPLHNPTKRSDHKIGRTVVGWCSRVFSWHCAFTQPVPHVAWEPFSLPPQASYLRGLTDTTTNQSHEGGPDRVGQARPSVSLVGDGRARERGVNKKRQ